MMPGPHFPIPISLRESVVYSAYEPLAHCARWLTTRLQPTFWARNARCFSRWCCVGGGLRGVLVWRDALMIGIILGGAGIAVMNVLMPKRHSQQQRQGDLQDLGKAHDALGVVFVAKARPAGA